MSDTQYFKNVKAVTGIQAAFGSLWRLARKRPRLAIAVALALALMVGVVIRHLPRTSAPQYTYYPVKRNDFLVSIIEGGTLKAVHEVTVRSELEGVARIISIVPEGVNVRQGDLLVELDSSDLRERLGGQQVTFENAQFAFVQAKENLAIQKSLVESNVKDAELKVEFARSDLSKYLEGDWPQLEKDTKAKIAIAEEELTRAEDRYNWTQQLQQKGYATKSELDADSLAVKRKQIELAQSQEQLRLLTKYDFPKRKRALEAAVEQAEKELERLKLRSAAQIAQVEASLKSQSATLELQEKRLNELKQQLELTRIYAPQDGLVVYASSSNPGSGVLIEEGATVRQKQDIIKLPDVSQMMLEIRVHESHVQKIKPGLQAYVTIDSLPDRQFEGSIRKVAVLPDSSSRYFNPNLKVYTTEVLIEDEIPDLKPGISGRAEVIITNLQNVLTVPIQAVTTLNGRQVCLVEKNGAAKPVPVDVGMYSDRLIEIKSGLKEGDLVALSALSSSDNIDMTGSIVDAEKAGTNRSASRKTNAMIEAAKLSDGDRKTPKILTAAAATGGVTNRPAWNDPKKTNSAAPVSASVPTSKQDRKK
jgi:HlyD family secretion protein